MEIRFTKYAKLKFKDLAELGITISEEQVIEIIKNQYILIKSQISQILSVTVTWIKIRLLGLCIRRRWYNNCNYVLSCKERKVFYMKFRYDKTDDVLMIWFSKKPVDYAEQTKNVIMHFSKENKPVLMEILDASKFLKETSQAFPKEIRQQVLSA